MSDNSNEFWLVTLRGLIGRCPHCGEGKLFASYLKPVAHCLACGENLGNIRSDDGPAWLTIIIVGHILAPLLLNIIPDSTLPIWQLVAIFLSLTLLLSLIILPRAKGIFIGILWRMGNI